MSPMGPAKGPSSISTRPRTDRRLAWSSFMAAIGNAIRGNEPAKRYDNKPDNPQRITALVNIPFQVIQEGYCYRHVHTIIVATNR